MILSLLKRRDQMRVALVFFGITRSVKLTSASIRQNLIDPARGFAADLRLFGHFFDQPWIDNPRSAETGPLDPAEHQLLPLDEVELEAPNTCLAQHGFDWLKAQGDPWDDDFASLRNLVHQLHSLRRVTEMTLEWRPDLVIFARPDLCYHDSAAPYLREMAAKKSAAVLLPNWCQWHGENDRFAFAKGRDAISAYGLRVNRLGDYCRQGNAAHSERLLQHALHGVSVQRIAMRASRVRSNGMMVVEDFTPGRGMGGKRSLVPFDPKRPVPAVATAPRVQRQARP